MADSAFKAPFRITENRFKKTEYSPEQNVSVDFTPEQARAAADWLLTAADKALKESTKIRVYSTPTEFKEVVGFTLWGGLWGQRGSFSPLKHETKEDLPF